MSEVIKICSKHGKLFIDDVLKQKNSTTIKGYSYRCRKCKRERDHIYKEKNRKILCEKNKIYKQNNKDIINAWNKLDRERNPQKYKEWARKTKEKNWQKNSVHESLRQLGITREIYDNLVEKQNNKCAICNKEETRKSRRLGNITRLCIDHNHNDGRIRGLLCHSCNTGIGKFKDSIELLESAINYLKKHQERKLE